MEYWVGELSEGCRYISGDGDGQVGVRYIFAHCRHSTIAMTPNNESLEHLKVH